MSEEPDRPMNFLRTSTGLTVYRVVLVSICLVSLAIWTVTITILGIAFMFCVPGIINELINWHHGEQQEKLFTSGKYQAPYQLFVFVWNGFRSKKG